MACGSIFKIQLQELIFCTLFVFGGVFDFIYLATKIFVDVFNVQAGFLTISIKKLLTMSENYMLNTWNIFILLEAFKKLSVKTH